MGRYNAIQLVLRFRYGRNYEFYMKTVRECYYNEHPAKMFWRGVSLLKWILRIGEIVKCSIVSTTRGSRFIRIEIREFIHFSFQHCVNSLYLFRKVGYIKWILLIQVIRYIIESAVPIVLITRWLN